MRTCSRVVERHGSVDPRLGIERVDPSPHLSRASRSATLPEALEQIQRTLNAVATLPCVQLAALGNPVVPLVKIKHAGSCHPTPFLHSSPILSVLKRLNMTSSRVNAPSTYSTFSEGEEYESNQRTSFCSFSAGAISAMEEERSDSYRTSLQFATRMQCWSPWPVRLKLMNAGMLQWCWRQKPETARREEEDAHVEGEACEPDEAVGRLVGHVERDSVASLDPRREEEVSNATSSCPTQHGVSSLPLL